MMAIFFLVIYFMVFDEVIQDHFRTRFCVAQTPRLYAEGGPQPSYGEKEAFNFTVLVPPGEFFSAASS